ncbi:MAG TPA: twin-arginine translocation signal domain-containing protein [Ktedonobacterales bacterium]|jgi:hypothetical protein
MKVSRRKFIAGASVGAVAVGAGIAVPVIAASKSPAPTKSAGTSSNPLMVYVTNPSSGDVELLVGSKAVRFHDPDLVARLLKAAQ